MSKDKAKVRIFKVKLKVIIMRAAMIHDNLMNIQSNLLNFAMVLTSNRDDAYDLLQDTTIKVLENHEKFEDGTNFKSWAFTIMRNIFINNYRKGVAASTVVDTTDDLYHMNLSQVDSDNEPEGTFTANEIIDAIKTLNEEMRKPLALLVTGYKYEEVATMLSIPVGTVKTRVFNARKILQRKFADYRTA